MPLRLSLLWSVVVLIGSIVLAAEPPAGPPADAPAPKAKPAVQNAKDGPVAAKTMEDKATEAKPDAAAGEKAGTAKRGLPSVTHSKYASVVKEHPGQQTLVISYPWKTHDQASVEVRLMAAERSEKVAVSPLYFYADYYSGEVKRKIYRCLDGAEQGATDTFTKDKTEFKIVGERNSLARSAVVVLPHTAGHNPTEKPLAVFPLLASWGIDDRTLALDLPRDVFEAKGTLHVWFLRGEKVLWEDSVEWPGY